MLAKIALSGLNFCLRHYGSIFNHFDVIEYWVFIKRNTRTRNSIEKLTEAMR